MTARILTEISVGLTEEIQAALEIACEFTGTKPSQFARQALLERLVREQYLQHPGIARIEQKSRKSGPINTPEFKPAA